MNSFFTFIKFLRYLLLPLLNLTFQTHSKMAQRGKKIWILMHDWTSKFLHFCLIWCHRRVGHSRLKSMFHFLIFFSPNRKFLLCEYKWFNNVDFRIWPVIMLYQMFLETSYSFTLFSPFFAYCIGCLLWLGSFNHFAE